MGFFPFRNRKDQAVGSPDGSPFRLRSEEPTGARSRKRKEGADPVDPTLPERQRARRRLVGAATLVLAAVVGLPMVLDSEPRPLGDDVVIDIPAKERARSAPVKLPLAETLDAREELLAEAVPANAKSTQMPPSSPTASSDAMVDAAKSDAPARGAPQEVDAQPGAPTGKRLEAKPATDAKADLSPPKPGILPAPDKNGSMERKPEKPADKVPDQVGEKNGEKSAERSERFHVQVGAFSSPEKVRDLQNKLQAAGIKSNTQKVTTPSGERIRVRVGPVEGKAEAEKVRARLARIGLNGTLVPA